MVEQKPARLTRDDIDRLIQYLRSQDYVTLGPIVRDGAIVYEEIEGAADLPAGWSAEQEAGRYRLERGPDSSLFGYAVGPQSWKKYLHPAHVKLFEADQQDGQFRILDSPPLAPRRPYAFIGVRACELAAITVQDRVLLYDKFRDPVYGARRDPAFIVAVPCTRAAPTCFCASMGTGPDLRHGSPDLAITEMATPGEHWFLAEARSTRGGEALAHLECPAASEEDQRQAMAAVESAAARQTRRIDTGGLRAILNSNFEHPRWEEVSERCLNCANCTMVCPTCFCTEVEDVSDVTGNHAERWRRWDSCFSLKFSYIHGGSVRTSSKARYRQWLTHKLSAWIDQFGSSGCVGCGRCITWCPGGIDITEEAQALRGAVNHGSTIA